MNQLPPPNHGCVQLWDREGKAKFLCHQRPYRRGEWALHKQVIDVVVLLNAQGARLLVRNPPSLQPICRPTPVVLHKPSNLSLSKAAEDHSCLAPGNLVFPAKKHCRQFLQCRYLSLSISTETRPEGCSQVHRTG